MPMLTLFDKQIQLRMGQANVKRWVDDIMPLPDRRATRSASTLRDPPAAAAEAPHAYEIFQKKQDGAIKIVLHAVSARLSAAAGPFRRARAHARPDRLGRPRSRERRRRK